MATYKEVFLTCKRTSADIHERLSIIEAKVAKAQQLAKEQVRLHAPCLVATSTSVYQVASAFMPALST